MDKYVSTVPQGRKAYISVLTNEAYFPGLCALAYSLHCVKAAYPLYVLIPSTTDDSLKANIKRVGVMSIELPPLELSAELKEANPYARWNDTFFKLQIFGLVQFDKIVFLDLDMIIVQNIDELFSKPHMSAVAAGHCAHDWWTRLNSGLMVIEPNRTIYNKMICCIPTVCRERLARGEGFGDQDVINYYYSDWWHHKELILPEIYNAVTFDFETVCKYFGYENLKVIHYAQPPKLWQMPKWRVYRHIINCIWQKKWDRAKMCCKYMRYLRLSKNRHNL